MTVQESVNRTNNLLATSVIALAGFAFFPEFFIETEAANRLDEGLLLLLAVGAIIWYRRGQNRFKRSVAPIWFVGGALAIKILAVILEHSDKEDLGDDMGALVLFILATALVVWLYRQSAKLLAR